MHYHEETLLKLRDLYQNPSMDNAATSELILDECPNRELWVRLVRFFPPMPTDLELKNDTIEISIFKKK